MNELYHYLYKILIFAFALGILKLLVFRLIDESKRKKRRRYYQDKRAANDAEHAKVTRQMRYEVLRRDRFKCVKCGRSAKDGVRLHVDHIVPVSRGGKSVMNNLQTLCEDCNCGKGNRYSE